MDINKKLFFQINGLAGKSRVLDFFGKFGAEFVVLFMVALFLLTAWWAESFWSLFWFAFSAWILGWVFSFGLALLVKEKRPSAAFPKKTKIMFKSLIEWKSFPSDHARAAFLLFFIVLFFHLPLLWIFLFLALWVSFGRVYVGAHYPLDILGGASLALLTFWIIYFLA